MPPRSAAPCDHSGITLLMELVCRYSSAARMMCQVRDHETKALCRRFSITPFRGRFRSSSSAVSAAADNLLAHLAVVPLVLEARGLDVAPEMVTRLERVGDSRSAEVLRRIYRDEIGHVATGLRWFERLCRARGLVPEEVFRDRVRRCFKGDLKPPFNHKARAAAGFPPHYYEPLASG